MWFCIVGSALPLGYRPFDASSAGYGIPLQYDLVSIESLFESKPVVHETPSPDRRSPDPPLARLCLMLNAQLHISIRWFEDCLHFSITLAFY